MNDHDTIPLGPLNAALVLADGKVFFGRGVGAHGTTLGEICFNTSITGYQEILTDPSYDGQIITFTFPHIGNVGTTSEDVEAVKPRARGLVLRAEITEPSNFRSTLHLDSWLKQHGMIGISGVDTRALTRHIRSQGAQNAAVCVAAEGETIDLKKVKKALKKHPSLKGMELAVGASRKKVDEDWKQKPWTLDGGYTDLKKGKYHIAVIDYGVKNNILRRLVAENCRLTILPANTDAKTVLALKPDGIMLSNGPGDPAATAKFAVPEIQKLVKSGTPIFGICLGHQLLATALGCKTEKMKQGHRGANHPIQDLDTKKVEITSQNHGFVVSQKGLPKSVEITHVSLFDGTIQGIRVKDKPIFSMQGHPEASPGPHDTHYIFKRFTDVIKKSGGVK
jgi:carbamoyl-phosphate synthase small subunit